MRTVVNGDMVTVHYTGTLDGGEVFDSSTDGEPLRFQVGSGQIIQGFNDAMIGMEIGAEKTITLPPEQAYGHRDEELVRKIPRSIVGSQFKPETGMTIGIQMEDGTKMPANITMVTDESITIDMNPPLAGKTLNFKIQLIDISAATSSCGCGCGSTCGSSGSGSSCGCC